MAGYLPPEPRGPEPDLGQPVWGQQQQPWAWQPTAPSVPDNGSAVAGFVLSLVAAGLLLISVGLSSIVSIVCAALGIFYSRRGRQRVDRGETPKHGGLAQAGFVTGIVTLVLALLATAFWVVIIVLLATDDQFRRDFEGDFEAAALAIDYMAALLP